jgi:hypothetical protein
MGCLFFGVPTDQAHASSSTHAVRASARRTGLSTWVMEIALVVSLPREDCRGNTPFYNVPLQTKHISFL